MFQFNDILRHTQTHVLGSFSTTFYVQLLRLYVPKVPYNTANLTVFFAHSGSACIKAVRKNIDEIDTWCQFYQHLIRTSFLVRKCSELIFYSLTQQSFGEKKIGKNMLVKLTTGGQCYQPIVTMCKCARACDLVPTV